MVFDHTTYKDCLQISILILNDFQRTMFPLKSSEKVSFFDDLRGEGDIT